MKRSARAVWFGSGWQGRGELTMQSNLLQRASYSFNSRFASESGTNPEELLAAAHASCFTMKLSFVLAEAGFVPEELETTVDILFENGFITASHLSVTGTIVGISTELFNTCVQEAEKDCPVSRVLNAKITIETKLKG